MSMETPGPLSGIRVLDHGHVWAGPLLGMSFKDMGAEVIKIQSPSGNSGVSMGGRGMPGTTAGGDVQELDPMGFHAFDRGKKSLTLNLQSPEGIEIYKRLVAKTDVIVENFSARVMPALGLAYEVLSEINPRIILASLSASGATEGPWRDLVTYGPSLAALYGIKSVLGYHDSEHPQEDQADLDPTAAGHAFFATLAALEARDRTGKGQHLDIAQGEASIQRIGEPIMDYLLTGRIAGPQGNRYPGMAPHGFYRCSGEDSWISISIRDEDEWTRLIEFCGDMVPAIRDERFSTLSDRLTFQDELDSILERWTIDYESWDLTRQLQKIRIPAYPVMGAIELAADENFNALNQSNLVMRNTTYSKEAIYRGVVWKLDDGWGEISGSLPKAGADNNDILIDLLGYDGNTVKDFEMRGVI